MFTPTFKVRILYKSGNSAVIDGMVQFDITGNRFDWKSGGKDKILRLSPDSVEAVFYTINPWYKNLCFAIWRKFNG